jgi:hypothetical protein
MDDRRMPFSPQNRGGTGDRAPCFFGTPARGTGVSSHGNTLGRQNKKEREEDLMAESRALLFFSPVERIPIGTTLSPDTDQ